MAFLEGSGGGTKATLLWTNPNPTSTFVAQTVNIDLSDYDYVMFEVEGLIPNQYGGQDSHITYTICDKSDGFGNIGGSYYAPGINAYCSRIVTMTNSSVTFAVGKNMNGTDINYIAVPLKIYGLKKSIV